MCHDSGLRKGGTELGKQLRKEKVVGAKDGESVGIGSFILLRHSATL